MRGYRGYMAMLKVELGFIFNCSYLSFYYIMNLFNKDV